MINTEKVLPVKEPKLRYSYIGFTTDIGWPKKMNTGRVLYKSSEESEKRKIKLKKR